VEFGPVSRLIVISNRVSSAKPRSVSGNQGGLSVALAAALSESRGLWFGWSGEKTEVFTGRSTSSARTASPPRPSTSKSRTSTNIITATPIARSGRSSTTASILAEYDRSFGAGYERVNERFAETVAPLIEPDDSVWVHDYH
jgi:trehalose 6-phosphate synthase